MPETGAGEWGEVPQGQLSTGGKARAAIWAEGLGVQEKTRKKQEVGAQTQ